MISLSEELLKERSIESALSGWKEQRVPDRLNAEALVAVLSTTLDKPADHELVLGLVSALRKEGLITCTQVNAANS